MFPRPPRIPLTLHAGYCAVLDPRSTWADPAAYDAQARKLATMFAENFTAYAEQVTPEVRAAGPQPARGAA